MAELPLVRVIAFHTIFNSTYSSKCSLVEWTFNTTRVYILYIQNRGSRFFYRYRIPTLNIMHILYEFINTEWIYGVAFEWYLRGAV